LLDLTTLRLFITICETRNIARSGQTLLVDAAGSHKDDADPKPPMKIRQNRLPPSRPEYRDRVGFPDGSAFMPIQNRASDHRCKPN